MNNKASDSQYPDKAMVTELMTLAKQLQEDDLDDMVHDAASELASAANNEGVYGQVRFLVDQYGVQNTINLIKFVIESREEKKDGSETG